MAEAGDDALRELQARRDLLAFCARVLLEEADAALFDAIASGGLQSVSDAVGTPLLEPDLLREGRDRSLEALAEEYARLFVGPRPLCSPYASAHSREALLGGRARAALVAFADRQGLELQPEGVRVASPDHLGLALGMLSALHARAADTFGRDAAAHGEALEAARVLCEEHLRSWAPELLRRVASNTRWGLYRAAARLSLALIDPDGAYA